MLIRHGYGVLLLDRRGEGASEGDYNAFGWAGEPDLRAAIAFLQRQPDVDPARIGGLGLSVGGELLLQTAAHTRALRAVVSEGAGRRSLAEHLDDPSSAVSSAGSPGCSRRPRRWPCSRTAAARRPRRSHAADRAPSRAADRGRERQPGRDPQRRLRRPRRKHDRALEDREGGHTGALAAAPADYEQRVAAFFDRALR